MPQPAQIAGSLEQVQFRLESIESNMAGLATQSALDALALRVKFIESGMACMATKSDLNVLGAQTIAAIKDLQSEMFRMIWLQGAALATLILGLAGIMLTLALS